VPNEPTLMSEFREALDEVLPPAPWLAATVAEDLRRRRSARSTVRDTGRSPSRVAVAAGLMMVLLAVGLAATFLAAQLYAPVPGASPTHSPTIDPVELARLQARPLILPTVPPGGVCPFGSNIGTGLGEGPIYLSGKGVQATSKWGEYYDPTYYADRQVSGIVLIRIRDLKTGEAGVFVGPNAAGEVVGTDTIDGTAVEQHGYAVLHVDRPPTLNKPAIWHVRQGWAAGWSGCWGFQLDGLDFSQVITGEVTPGS